MPSGHAQAPGVDAIGSQSAGGRPLPAAVILGATFTDRVRQLPPNTVHHIPVALRERSLRAWVDCLQGMAADVPGWAQLEEARSRLLHMQWPRHEHGGREL
eukprot:915148-Karenia_brevis.AAC.1